MNFIKKSDVAPPPPGFDVSSAGSTTPASEGMPKDFSEPLSAMPSDFGAASGSAKAPRDTKLIKEDWVFDLQRKLIDKAKELGVAIDLGKTGKKEDGVDGAYGGKTRKAVEDVAAKLGIKDPLDSKGRPTDAFKTALGLGAAPTVPGKSEAAQPGPAQSEAGRPFEPVRDMVTVPVGGVEFSMAGLLGALPPDMSKKADGGKVVALSGAEALRRFRAIRNGVETGGLPAGPPIPKMIGLSSPDKYEEVKAIISEIHKILVDSLKKLYAAVGEEIARKRKEMNLPEKFSSGSTQEAYMSEMATYKLPQAIIQGLTYAYESLYDYLDEVSGSYRTNPQSLLELMKSSEDVAVDKDFPRENWTNEQAQEVGKVLMAAGGWLGKRIVPEDTSKYYKGTADSGEVHQEWRTAFNSNSGKIWPILRKQKQ